MHSHRTEKVTAAAWIGLGVIACLSNAPALSQTQTTKHIRLQQEMLVWTTEYEGLIDGVSGAETVKAINKFQARIGNPVTGYLTQSELEELVRQGTAKKNSFGFKQITDNDAGISVGIPLRLVPNSTRTKWGNTWNGRTADLTIDTLRFGADVSLDQLFDRLRSINNRKVAYERKTDTWFVIAAFEKDSAVYVRADVVAPPNRQSEIRGFSIWMSKDRPADYQAIPPAMLSSFRSDAIEQTPVTSSGPTASVNAPGPFPPNLQVNPPRTQPIPTVGPAPSVGQCFRGLGDCPSMLTYR
jgi:hypothetical protein